MTERRGQRGQSRITYTAAQNLHGAKVEREGRTEEKKIEEEERQHTVKPSEDKMKEIALCETGESRGQQDRERYKMKRGVRDQRNTQDQRLKNMQPALTVHHNSYIITVMLLFYNTST